MMYHYTNIDALTSIMGMQNDTLNACPTFRAFDVRSYEDQEELTFDFSFLHPIMQKVEEDLNIPYLSRLSRIEERAILTGYTSEKVVDFKEENEYIPYVLCLSTISGNEYLWNISKKDRVCIHIDESNFSKKEKNCMRWGKPVMYGLDIIRIESELKNWYNTYQSYFDETNILNDINRNEFIIMSALRYDIYPFIKPDKEPYTLESEYRVVCAITDKELIRYTEKGRAYYELQLPKSAVERIDFSQSTSNQKIHDIQDKLILSGYTAKIEGRSIIL